MTPNESTDADGESGPLASLQHAMSLHRAGHLNEAEPREITNVRGPAEAEAQNELGCMLQKECRTEEALAAFRRSIEIDPKGIEARRNLAFLLFSEERPDEALAALHDWRRDDPESPVARHMLAAFSGKGAPARAEDEYIQLMFDRLAAEYDEHLANLNYRGPNLIAQALRDVSGPPAGARDILDAGCGTGLCGPAMRPFAKSLIGVDLSPKMLVKAERRGCYDQLVAGELTAFLLRTPAAWDAIVSADALNYFGDLAPVCAAAAAALRPGGLFLFTTEAAGESDAAFKLNWYGRYTHSESYLREILAAAGLVVEELALQPLRHEGGRPVAARLVVARRPQRSMACRSISG